MANQNSTKTRHKLDTNSPETSPIERSASQAGEGLNIDHFEYENARSYVRNTIRNEVNKDEYDRMMRIIRRGAIKKARLTMSENGIKPGRRNKKDTKHKCPVCKFWHGGE